MYAKFENGVLKPAQSFLFDGHTTIINPGADDYKKFGYLPVIDNGGDGIRSYEDRGDAIVAVYSPMPPRVRTFAKARVAQWLRSHDKWVAFKELLFQSDDISFYWSTCTSFDDSHPDFATNLSSLCAALSLTDADRDDLLNFAEGATDA